MAIPERKVNTSFVSNTETTVGIKFIYSSSEIIIS